MLLNLCRFLDKEKFEIVVYSVIGSGPLLSEFEKLGIKVKVFNKKTKLGFGVIWQIFKNLKRYRPQIVHTHLFAADFWGKIAAILAGVPVIITTEHSVNLEESVFKQKVKVLLSYFTDKIVAVSQAVRNHYVEKVKIRGTKVIVIYNGVDLNRFVFRGFRPIDLTKPINAVMVARLEEVKGHKYLIEAMPLILGRYPNLILNIVGDGSLRKKLEEQARDLKLSDKIVFWREVLEPEKIFSKMDFFILPSLWEGLGISLLEAQAFGLPVLTSDIPGATEVVEDGKTGLLFEVKNPQAISKSIDRLLSNPKLQEKLVQEANKQVREKFDLQIMVRAYIDLYLDLLRSKRYK